MVGRGAPRIPRAARAESRPSRCTPLHGRGPSPHGRCSPSCGTLHRRTPQQAPRRTSPGTSTPGRRTRISPGAGPRAASQWRPRQRSSASRHPSSGSPTRGRATSCRRARSRPPRQTWSGDGTRGGRNRCQTPGSSRYVLTHGHPGPCRPSRQGGLPTESTPRRGPAPQPAGGSGLDTVEGGGRAPEPEFSPAAGPGATPRRGQGARGVGGAPARHSMQVDHCGRPAALAIATGVSLPPTGGPPLGRRSRFHKGSVEGHAEPPQGVDDEPGPSATPTPVRQPSHISLPLSQHAPLPPPRPTA